MGVMVMGDGRCPVWVVSDPPCDVVQVQVGVRCVQKPWWWDDGRDGDGRWALPGVLPEEGIRVLNKAIPGLLFDLRSAGAALRT